MDELRENILVEFAKVNKAQVLGMLPIFEKLVVLRNMELKRRTRNFWPWVTEKLGYSYEYMLKLLTGYQRICELGAGPNEGVRVDSMGVMYKIGRMSEQNWSEFKVNNTATSNSTGPYDSFSISEESLKQATVRKHARAICDSVVTRSVKGRPVDEYRRGTALRKGTLTDEDEHSGTEVSVETGGISSSSSDEENTDDIDCFVVHTRKSVQEQSLVRVETERRNQQSTPRELVNKLLRLARLLCNGTENDKEFGCDPAALSSGRHTVPAQVRYCKEDDGLASSSAWEGKEGTLRYTVFINCPFLRVKSTSVSDWIDKFQREEKRYQNLGIDQYCLMLLVQASFGTQWSRSICNYPKVLLKDRPAFGSHGRAAPFDCMLVVAIPEEKWLDLLKWVFEFELGEMVFPVTWMVSRLAPHAHMQSMS